MNCLTFECFAIKCRLVIGRLSCLMIVAHLCGYSQAQDVQFLDTNFEKCLIEDTTININKDAVITVFEATKVKRINCAAVEIINTKGLEEFVSLEDLSLTLKDISSLDLSFTNDLELLTIYDNSFDQIFGLNKLNLGSNSKLLGMYLFNTFIVNIPFKSLTEIEYVVINNNTGIDTLDLSNNDSLKYISCNSSGIQDMVISSGQLEDLYCSNNEIKNIDITKLNTLKRLDCSHNLIDNIEIVANNNLETIYCQNNQLDSLNLSLLMDLSILNCDSNSFNFLDISKNKNLSTLRCRYNNLELLNLRNSNNLFLVFDSKNNPNLKCITVDDKSWSNLNWKSYVDNHSIFSEDCALSTTDVDHIRVFRVFPNPTSSQFVIDPNNVDVSYRYKLISSNGMIIKFGEAYGKVSISLEDYNDAIYFLELESESGITVRRILKI